MATVEYIGPDDYSSVDSIMTDNMGEKIPWYESVKKDSDLKREDMREDCIKHIWDRVQAIQDSVAHKDRMDEVKEYLKLYNVRIKSKLNKSNKMMDMVREPSSYNVVRSCINTALSKIGNETPAISFQTNGQDFSIRQAAQQLDDVLEGEFEKADTYEEVKLAVKDAMLLDVGIMCVMFSEKKKRLMHERINPCNFFVDDGYGEVKKSPEVFFRKKYSVWHIIEKFKLDGWQKKYLLETTSKARNKVWLYQGFQKDKTHVTFVEGLLLKKESWEGWPPLFYYRWSEADDTFFGTGIAREIINIQYRINRILVQISKSTDLFAIPRIVLNQTNKIVNTEITNELGAIVKMTGASTGTGKSKIDFMTPPILNQQYFQHLEELYQKAYQQSGISAALAQGEKPKGLTTGKAIIAHHDSSIGRFAAASSALTKFYVSIGRYSCILLDLYYTGKKGKGLLYKIKWAIIDLKNNYNSIKVKPKNLLSDSPAGKLEDVNILITSGLVPPNKAIGLLDFPDVKKVIDVLMATENATEYLLEKMVTSNVPVSPDDKLPLEMQLQAATSYYAKLITEDAPEDVLEKISEFINQCRALVNKEQEAMKQDQIHNLMMQEQQKQQASEQGQQPQQQGPPPPQGPPV